MMCRIAAVVVTYNRRDKLLRCIDAIMKQTAEVRPDIFVVDNGSSDGTEEAVGFMRDSLSPEDAGRILYSNLRHNSGGAGGFCYGIRKAAEAGYDFMWLMDDDCIPSDTALEELLKYEADHHGEYGFLSSRVLWTDGSVHRMNIQRRTVTEKVSDYEIGVQRIRIATFVSLFLPIEVVSAVGLPFREFYIWTDDWEYTMRISRSYSCFLIYDSVVVHDTKTNSSANLATAPENTIYRFRYRYRNDVYMFRSEGVKGNLYEAAKIMIHLARIAVAPLSLKSKNERAMLLLRATYEGVSFFPKPERAFVKNDTRKKARKLRVLEAFGEPISFGGEERFALNVLEHMDMDGITIDFLTPYYCDNGKIADKVREAGGDLYTLGCEFKPGKTRCAEKEHIRKFLSERHYDVIHIHSGSNSMLAIYAAAAANNGIRRIIVHSHCTGTGVIRHSIARLANYMALCRFPTDYCACSTEAGRWQFPNNVCSQKLKIINNGIETERFRFNNMARERIRNDLEILDEEIVIGNVGRLTIQKNQLFLIELLGEIRKENGAYKLLLVGEGEDRDMLKSKTEALGLEDKVIFADNTNRIEEYYSAMDIFAIPSFFEGLPLSMIEAQTSGLIVVASDRISKESDVSGNVEFVSLEKREMWKSALMGSHDRIPGAVEIVRNSGFDVRDTASVVRKLYIHDIQDSLQLCRKR